MGAGWYDKDTLACYYAGQVKDVPGDAFKALLGWAVPESHWDREQPLELNDTFAQLQYAKGWVGQLVYQVTKRQVDKGMVLGKPDLNALFRYNMPVRSIAKMTGGAVSMEMAEALLEIFNGQFLEVSHILSHLYIRKEKETRDTAKALGKGNRHMIKLKKWIEKHSNIWEFVLFNLHSNCATMINFAVMWFCSGFIFADTKINYFHGLFFDMQQKKVWDFTDF